MTRHIGICDTCARLVRPDAIRPMLLLLLVGGCYTCGQPLGRKRRSPRR